MPSTKSTLLNFVALTALISLSAPASFAGKPDSVSSLKSSKTAQTKAKATESAQEAASAQDEASATEASGTDVESAYAAAVEKASALRAMAQNQSLEHYDLARYYWSRWNLKMADLEFQAAIMYFPELKVAHRDLSILSMFNGHPSRAIAELMMVVGLGEPIPVHGRRKSYIQKASRQTPQSAGNSLRAQESLGPSHFRIQMGSHLRA